MTKERRFFKGRFEIRLGAVHVPDARVRLAVQVNPNMVEEMFVVATFMNGQPCRTSALRAEAILRRLSGSECSWERGRLARFGVRNVHADRLTWARTPKTDVVRFPLTRIA